MIFGCNPQWVSNSAGLINRHWRVHLCVQLCSCVCKNMCLLKDRLLSSKKKMFLFSYYCSRRCFHTIPHLLSQLNWKKMTFQILIYLYRPISKNLAREKPKTLHFYEAVLPGMLKRITSVFHGEEMKKGNYWHGLISLSSSKENCLWLFWRLHPQCGGTNTSGVGIWKEIRPWDVFISFWPWVCSASFEHPQSSSDVLTRLRKDQ